MMDIEDIEVFPKTIYTIAFYSFSMYFIKPNEKRGILVGVFLMLRFHTSLNLNQIMVVPI
jgi:hypothetical protein